MSHIKIPSDGTKITVNFENFGKRVINIENVKLEKVDDE